MTHAKDITIGSARVVYRGEWWGRDVWALPGREYTYDKAEAEAAAETIDIVINAKKLIEILRSVQ